MSGPTSNIKAVARDICSKHLSRFGGTGTEFAAEVDRYLPCVAAQLESRQIDETGDRVISFDLERSLEALPRLAPKVS